MYVVLIIISVFQAIISKISRSFDFITQMLNKEQKHP
jgi:Flp pilus assembly pilin Flp